MVGASFHNLKGIDGEILAQARDRDGGGGAAEVFQRTCKELVFGEDTEDGGAGCLELRCKSRGIEVRANEPPGG